MEIGMDDPRGLEHLLVTRMVRFNATVQGIVTGLVLGLIVFVATIWLVIISRLAPQNRRRMAVVQRPEA